LTNGISYTIRIRVVDSVGSSDFTNTISAIPGSSIADLFDGSAGVLLSNASRSPRWGNLSVEGSQSSLRLTGTSSAERGPTDVYGNSGSVLDTGRSNFYAVATIATANGFVGLYGRTTGSTASPGNYSVGYTVFFSSGTTGSINRNQRFSSVALTTFQTPQLQTGDTVGIMVNNSQIIALVNDVQIASVSDSTFSGNNFTGLSLGVGASVSRFDVFTS